MTEKHRFDLLADTRTCYRYLQIGFGVIVVTFVLGVTVLFVPDLIPVYEILVMPALFIGLGILLFGIGTHLHIIHLNVIRMSDEHGQGSETREDKNNRWNPLLTEIPFSGPHQR